MKTTTHTMRFVTLKRAISRHCQALGREAGRAAGPLLILMVAASVGFVLVVGYQAVYP